MISTSIKMGMAKKNVKTQELADELGVTRQAVSSWINNHSSPSHAMQIKMCEFFEVKMSKFMEWGE